MPLRPSSRLACRCLLAVGCAITTVTVRADGTTVDKIYHPYVYALERELEWRAVYEDEQPKQLDNRQLHRFAYGQAINDRWFGEIYLTGERTDHSGFQLEGYELEARWQLTEQGEYWADWGMLFELEKAAHKDSWEYTTGILAEKEWGRWSGTANFMVASEWGSDTNDELESSLGLQGRYRLSPSLEPAIEFYSGDKTRVLGPVLLGEVRMAGRQKLHWELGMLFGLDKSSTNNTLRALIEYEF
ncbi:hypothetical protein [Porticoccus sp.]